MATLRHKNTPIVVALYDIVLHSKGVRQRVPGKTLLFDAAYRLACRVQLTKLLDLDGNICLQLITLMVAALAKVGEALIVPEGIKITLMRWEALDNMLLKKTSRNYGTYGLISS